MIPRAAERWAELCIRAPSDAVEAVAAYVTLRGHGIEIRDEETALRGRGGTEIVLFVAPDAARRSVADLTSRFPGIGVEVYLRDEAEWRDVWKRYFKPLAIGPRFVVKPSWETYHARPEDLVLHLDPGRAFGTGNHESTRLVLETLELGPEPQSVLDVGTGSGILAIAALRVWPQAKAVAIDIDPEAVACATENAARNQVSDRLRIAQDTLDHLDQSFDLVLANLTREILLALGPQLRASVAPGGRAILSGMLKEELPTVAAQYETDRFRVVAERTEGEWGALVVAPA